MNDKSKIIIRVEPELHKKLKLKAVLESRSYNQIVTELLEEYLKDVKIPKSKKQ